jgi:bifunctional UDP-N-acetylglucosamine pyrophosphorylase/glucosamine-1-phosphate N-acetyltransferase
MATRSALAIILAAGEGTRMKSATPKVLHPIGGLPMLGHVLRAVAASGIEDVAVVVGNNAAAVADFVGKYAPKATTHVQAERLGTAHAVLAAREAIARGADDVLVLYADTPMVTPKTMRRIREALAEHALVFPGFRPFSPTGYGRLILEDGRVKAIREEKDATEEERKIDVVWPGIAGFRGEGLVAMLRQIGNTNAKGEYYLTDLVELANRAGKSVGTLEIDADEVSGVNDRQQLSHAEGLFQKVMREQAMADGATLKAPSTVWFSYDTSIGRDVTIEPNVYFGPGVSIGDNVTIRAFSHLEGATIAPGAIVGPFARLRPGAVLGNDVHVGNFVEVKNATLGEGAKANHLTYIGDADIGAKTNVGAGTITANYDGFDKYRTVVGAGASIGSNTVLVAPVKVGDGANVAAGSVIVHDVPADALAVARGRQEDKPGWAKKFREKKLAEKAARKKG